ncbi:hypothetical protein GCM10017752_16100 [Streptomyces roseoviridis]
MLGGAMPSRRRSCAGRTAEERKLVNTASAPEATGAESLRVRETLKALYGTARKSAADRAFCSSTTDTNVPGARRPSRGGRAPDVTSRCGARGSAAMTAGAAIVQKVLTDHGERSNFQPLAESYSNVLRSVAPVTSATHIPTPTPSGAAV